MLNLKIEIGTRRLVYNKRMFIISEPDCINMCMYACIIFTCLCFDGCGLLIYIFRRLSFNTSQGGRFLWTRLLKTFFFSAAPIGRCPYGMDGVSRPSVCMYVRNLTVRFLSNLACRISLWCRCAPSTFFRKISSLPVFSIYSYFNTSTAKLCLKI